MGQPVQVGGRPPARDGVTGHHTHRADAGQCRLGQGAGQDILALPGMDTAHDRDHEAVAGKAQGGARGGTVDRGGAACQAVAQERGGPGRELVAHRLRDPQQRVGAQQPAAHQGPEDALGAATAGPDLAHVHHVRRAGGAGHAGAAQHHRRVVVHHVDPAIAGQRAEHAAVVPHRPGHAGNARGPGERAAQHGQRVHHDLRARALQALDQRPVLRQHAHRAPPVGVEAPGDRLELHVGAVEARGGVQ